MKGTYCKRFGPGRLPYASRRDVGGGIAMAATALLAAVVWYAGALAVAQAGSALDAGIESSVGFFLASGVFVLPFVPIGSFAVGTLVWRSVIPNAPTPRQGALGGAATAIATLVIGSVGGATLLVVGTEVTNGAGIEALPELLAGIGGLSVLFLVLAAVAVGWLVVPVGAAGGWYHERARAEQRLASDI